MYLSEDERTLIQVDLADISGDGYFNLPDAINKIGFAACLDCENIKKLVFTENLTEIDESAFDGCTGLTQVIFPESLTEVGAWGFANCSFLNQVVVGESLLKIGASAFKGCTALESIVVNTQNAVELNRIRALFPEDLRSKVIDKAGYDTSLALQTEPLKQDMLDALYRRPQIKALTGSSLFFRAKEEPNLPAHPEAPDRLCFI